MKDVKIWYSWRIDRVPSFHHLLQLGEKLVDVAVAVVRYEKNVLFSNSA
jgi:hypothetical protein